MVLADVPGYQKRNDGTINGTTVPETGTRVQKAERRSPKNRNEAHSPKPSFYKTALRFLSILACLVGDLGGLRSILVGRKCRLEFDGAAGGLFRPDLDNKMAENNSLDFKTYKTITAPMSAHLRAPSQRKHGNATSTKCRTQRKWPNASGKNHWGNFRGNTASPSQYQ